MRNVIGIDVGGTKITGVLFDGKKQLKELTIVTPKNLFEFERNILKLTDFLSANEKISGVGIGMAGLVDPKVGVIKYSANFKFKGHPNIFKLFKDHGYKNVKIDNDANCFTRAEMLLGQGKNCKNFLGVILGTGMGGGMVLDGKLYRGQNNMGGEFGHLVVNGEFLEKPYQKARNANNYKELGIILGWQFAGLVNVFAPQALILGGGVSQNAHAKFIPGVQKEMKKFFVNEKTKVQVLASKLKNPGALGAALLFK